MSDKTALHPIHEQLGARFTDFGGWDMPLKYDKELEEHRAVREHVGVFDLSHMGELRLVGPGAAAALDHALVSRLSAIEVGKAKYSMICQEDGGIIDDLITYRIADEEFLVVPNAANAPVVAEEMRTRCEGFDVELTDETKTTTLIAVQGPRSAEVITDLLGEDRAEDVKNLRYYAAMPGTLAEHDVLIARTGYTGEDGFELFVANDGAEAVWDLVMKHPLQPVPCGLAARDTLRLEAGMPLYGHELNRELTPVAAGLGVLAATKSKDEFVGYDAILKAKESAPKQKLIGLKGEGKRAARAGYHITDAEGKPIGEVTSGALSPTLGYPIAMAYLDTPELERIEAAGETTVNVDIRGKEIPFTITAMPFYKREK